MKKIFGKNQVIITSLAVMIAIAGYLSVTQENADEAAKLAGTDTANVNEDGTAEETIFDISDEDITHGEGYNLTDSGEIIKEENDSSDGDDKAAQTATTETAGTEAAEGENVSFGAAELASEDNSSNIGEAVLVSSTIGTEYFDQAKLSREQTRSKNKEILMELVNSTTTTKEQKEKAVNEVISMTDDSEKETATENMLEAKGYGNSIVSIVDGSVDVIVNASELTQKDIAQIEDIVKRKTSVEASNIVITPVGIK